MFSLKSILAAAATFSLIASSSAQFNPSGKTNVAMYWGQGANQRSLKEFCSSSHPDIMIVGFITQFPPAANGYVQQNFGNGCWAGNEYKGPGYNGKYIAGNDLLLSQCPFAQDAIPKCQAAGKKVLLSIGGGVNTYKGQLKNAADGTYFANWVWKAYGPLDPTYKGVRPLDRGWNNITAGVSVDIDGFDFDIEFSSDGLQPNNGESAAYIAMIQRLRVLMNAQTAKTGKKYYITGAPQCSLNKDGKEIHMHAMIQRAPFDMLFIQYYNQGPNSCTARSRASKTGTFNWPAWVNYVNRGESKNAKLYIGLLGGASGSTYAPKDYLYIKEVQNLIKTYGKEPKFGGIMLWDANAADINNSAELLATKKKYWQIVKEALRANYPTKSRRHLSHMQHHQRHEIES